MSGHSHVRQSSLGFRVWRWPLEHRQQRHKPHTHSDIEINCLLQGRIRYVMGGHLCDIEAGELGIFWAGIPHQIVEWHEPLEGIWLTLPLDWLLRWQIPGNFAENLLAGQLVCHRTHGKEDGLLEQFQIKRWLREFNAKQSGALEILHLEVEALIRRLARSFQDAPRQKSVPVDDRRLQKFTHITDFLAAHYLEDISIDDVALAVRMHPKYMMQFFKKTAGMTVFSYLQRLRLAHAQRLLLTTDIKVIDAAYEAGFQSLSSFYHAYKQYYHGAKPTQLRGRMPAIAGGKLT